MMKIEQNLEVRGKVQGVMFRQTVIRSAMGRELECGASNDSTDPNLVHLIVCGERKSVEKFVEELQSIKPLNSWGASPESVEKVSQGIPFRDHQVTTQNVDEFKWSSGVEFYF